MNKKCFFMLDLHPIFSIFFRERKIDEAIAYAGINSVRTYDTCVLKRLKTFNPYVLSLEQKNFLRNDVKLYDKFKPSKHSIIIIMQMHVHVKLMGVAGH